MNAIVFVYINDIVHKFHSKIRFSADNTSLFIVVDIPISAALNLDIDLWSIFGGILIHFS